MLGVSAGWSEDGILGRGEFMNVGAISFRINAKNIEAAIALASRGAGSFEFVRHRQLSEGDMSPSDWREAIKASHAKDGSANKPGAWQIEVVRVGFARSPSGPEYDSDYLITKALFCSPNPHEAADFEDDPSYWLAERERRALSSLATEPRNAAPRRLAL